MSSQISFNLSAIVAAVSQERLSVYGYYADNTEAQNIAALAKYLWNVALSESFYPSIQLCEVSLRNQLHTHIAEKFNEPQWLNGEGILRGKREGEEVASIKQALIKRNQYASYHHIIPELSFGFWTGLLHKRYEGVLWPWLLKPCFPYLAKRNRTQSYVFQQLNDIRQLRNRIFHHEKISHIANLPTIHQEILDVISWMHPDMMNYAKIIDRFNDVYQQGADYYEQRLYTGARC